MAEHSELSAIVGSIRESYRAQHSISDIDSERLPNRDTIIGIIEQLRAIIFPGYFGKQDLATGSLEYAVGDLLAGIQAKLRVQVDKALRYNVSE